MPHPTFFALTGAVPPTNGELVVCLGRPEVLPKLPEERLLVFDHVDAAALGQIARLNPGRMTPGLLVVTAEHEHARAPQAVLQAHKLLIYLFTKFVHLPYASSRIPDPVGLRPDDAPPEYLHELQRDRNMGLLLRHPLVDKLRDERVGLPCLVLLPGPSLRQLKQDLPELARRHLIVTISRALPFLRECGVAPDVLVQLDTVPLQRQFHAPGERFPESVLLALSLAPVAALAPRFRQTFFIDSFDLATLPNPARMRESWLSSLIACLGAAEALAAPKILVVGSDLRLRGGNLYFNHAAPAAQDQELHEGPLTSAEGVVFLADAQGRRVETTLQLLATAQEAEFCAREIRAERRTSFFNLTPGALLDPELYRPLSVEQALCARPLDKSPLLDKADRAATKKEAIDRVRLFAGYEQRLHGARKGRDLARGLSLSEDGALETLPYYRYVAANLPWFRPADGAGLRLAAANLAEEVLDATRHARNMAALHLLGSAGEEIPVLATAEEEAEALALLARLEPDWKWRCVGLHGLEDGRPTPGGQGGRLLPLAELHGWLASRRVVVLAPGCAEEFGYALRLLARDNLIPLREAAAAAPLG